ncbi:MAG: phosphatidate cytidylyltransferase [Betaproteobacteria bacterium]|nr:phosphatidate cytidylyltransferase [Betaproteobacteria bacterium]
MLKTRVITALVILPVVLLALFALPGWGWALFTFGIVAAAVWEWSRLCRLPSGAALAYQVITLGICAVIFLAYDRGSVAGIAFEQIKRAGFVLSLLFWALVVPMWLWSTWKSPPVATAIAGWLVILPTWLALISLRDIGPWLLLSFAAIVWVADIAAYFIGRRFGKKKLAPAISPGKTIEGAYGAVAGVMLYFFLWRYLVGATPVSTDAWVRELQSHGWSLFGAFIVLSLFSIMGDLFESWMKRCAEMKDSSNLLPGHGGILDRIDALTSTLPLAGLYLLLMSR